MDGATYWQRRAQQQLIAAEQIAGQLEQRMQKAFQSAAKDIETQIYKLYGKYAADNGLSYAEAKKYLTRHELQAFQQDLDFYLEKARDPAYRKEYRAYLQALSTRARVSRLEEYQARLKIIAETLYTAEVVPDATATAKEVFTESYLRAGFDMSQFFGVALSFAMPSERLFRTITEYPWSGKSFSRKWQDNCSNFETVLNEVLTKGLVAGYSNQQMARELRDKTNAAYDRARRLVRTETNYIHNQATASLYGEWGVEYYEYLATLDTRTSPMCSALDGRRFRYTERKYGVNYPPLHPWCRSTTIPIVYEEDDIGTRIARDADGKNIKVLAGMKYAQWKQQFVDGKKEKIVPEFLPVKGLGNSVDDKALAAYIKSDLDKIPEKHKKLLQDYVSEIDIVGGRVSYYNPATRTIAISREAFEEQGILIHELGHALENRLDLYHDEKFLKVLNNGLEDVSPFDIIEDNETFSKPISILNVTDGKFVTEYQRRIYDTDYDGNGPIDYSRYALNPKSLLDYFSEGYRFYHIDPNTLKTIDPLLYRFIEEME